MSYLADQVAAGPRVTIAIPAEKAQDVIYVVGVGTMEWVDVVGAGAFSGYRCLEVGRPEWGSTAAPRGYELDMIGGLVPKAAYASLWAWAQQNGYSVTAAAWTTKVFKFADVDATYFRLPDLRDVFLRFTGTDVDTGNARTLGSYKGDTLKNHIHGLTYSGGGTGGWAYSAYSAGVDPITTSNGTTGVSTAGVAGAETAPRHTAFAPRIHI